MKARSCPFCGGEIIRALGTYPKVGSYRTVLYYSATCESCRSTGPHCETADKCIVAWNLRTDQKDLFAITLR